MKRGKKEMLRKPDYVFRPAGPTVEMLRASAAASISAGNLAESAGHDELLAACRKYLAGQRCALWGRAWGILDEDAEPAAEWLCEVIEDVLAG